MGKFGCVGCGAHSKKPRLLAGVSPRINRVHQRLGIADLLVKPRTAAAAKKGGEHLQRGDVLVPDIRNVPRKMKVRMLERPFIHDLTQRNLPRLAGHGDGGQGAGRLIRVTVADPLQNLVGIDCTSHDEEAVVRGITLAVVAEEIVASQPVKNIPVADDRVPIGAFRVGRLKQPAAGTTGGVIVAHVHFSADDIEFTGQLVPRQGGVLHDVTQDFGGESCAGVGNGDVINRAIERSVGVHLSARILDGMIDLQPVTVACALEQHVLEHMGHSGTQPFALVNRPRTAPSLNGHHGSGIVRLKNNLQPVR